MSDGSMCIARLKDLMETYKTDLKLGLKKCWVCNPSSDCIVTNVTFIKRSSLLLKLEHTHNSSQEYIVRIFVIIPENFVLPQVAEVLEDGSIKDGEKIQLLDEDISPWWDYIHAQINLMEQDMTLWKQAQDREKEQAKKDAETQRQKDLERANAEYERR